jgi:hypothetical protein
MAAPDRFLWKPAACERESNPGVAFFESMLKENVSIVTLSSTKRAKRFTELPRSLVMLGA